jgi:hypothetical protein
MSDIKRRKATLSSACIAAVIGMFPAHGAAESVSSSGAQAITGSGAKAITGSGARAITGSGARAITGSGARAITGSGARAITGSGARAITGSGARAITGSGARAITGSGARAITGSGARAITGSGARAITGSGARLLVLGRVEFAGSDFVSVLGQTVFVDEATASSMSAGSMIAVYGSIDFETGGITDASVLSAASAGFRSDSPSLLTGFVDSIDYSKGLAVVSGKAVDYNALLSDGTAPSVGDMVSVTGRDYAGINLLVADPQLELD